MPRRWWWWRKRRGRKLRKRRDRDVKGVRWIRGRERTSLAKQPVKRMNKSDQEEPVAKRRRRQIAHQTVVHCLSVNSSFVITRTKIKQITRKHKNIK